MTAIIRSTFRQQNAKSFVEYVVGGNGNSMYAAIGRNRPWTDELNPPAPGDNYNEDNIRWEETFALKRILPSNVSYVVPRYDWVSGATDFVAWSISDSNILAKKFYCVNSEYRVYKLITKGSGPSTVMPSGESSTNNYVQQLADGYSWKFMYQISASDAIQFLSTDWIPVKTLTSNDGSTQWTVQQSGINTPFSGHGIDPVVELGGFNVMIDAQLRFGEGGAFTTNNEFRAVCIILNPTLFGSSTVATATAIKQSRAMTLTSVAGSFLPDETIQASNGSQGQVVEQNGTTLNFLLSSALAAGTGFSTNQTITGLTSGATATITGVAAPTLAPGSGRILYIDNRRAIPRAIDQSEDLKIVLVF